MDSGQDSSEKTHCSEVASSDSLGAFLSTQEEPSFGHVVEYMRVHNGRCGVKVGDGISSVASLSQLRKDQIAVRILQKTLNEVNGSSLNVDGKFDSVTECELKSFQKNHRINETGQLDLNTAEAIIYSLREQRKRTRDRGNTTILPTMITHGGCDSSAPNSEAVCNLGDPTGHTTKRESPIEMTQRMITQYRSVAEKGDIDSCKELYQSLKIIFTKSISSAERKEVTIQWLDNYRSHKGDLIVADYFQEQLNLSGSSDAKSTNSESSRSGSLTTRT